MTYSRISAAFFFRVIFVSLNLMQVLASLRRRTKSGVSVWHFCYDKDTSRHFAVGGDKLEVKSATSRKHLRQMHDSFKRYGYRKDLPARKTTTKPMAPVADPWDSLLPLDLQLQLDAVA